MLQKRNTRKTNGRVLAAVLGLVAVLVVSIGCGGGGGGGGNGGGNGGGGNETATVAIAWPTQSRVVNAPSSAESARISLLNNTVSVASMVVNRPVSTSANTQNYTLNSVPVGNFTLNITFFAEQNAPSNGTVVGTASKSVTIVTGANDLGNVTVVGTADSISIPGGQSVGAGNTVQLVATALDNGVPIPVADGAFTWSVIAGGSNGTVSNAGVLTGITAGTVTVQAVLDNGETNLTATQTVTVTTGGGSGGGGGTWVPANKIFYTAVPDNDPTQIAIRHVDPNTEVVTDFLTLPINVVAAAPNPSVANQLIFAYTTNPGPSATYAFYKNTSLTTVGATKITNEAVNAFETVGTIQVTPDGSKIMFTAAIGTDFAVYTMNSDGGNLKRIDDADDANLSPDGTKIVYSKLEGGDANIWVIGINDVTGTVIYNSDSDDIEPQWNKSGTKIAFASLQAADLPTSNFDIYTILPDGEQLTRVTATEDDERSPTWGPDGRIGYLLIALASDISLNGIYLTTDGQIPPTDQIVSDPSVSAPLYWTNNQGRALEAGWGQRSRNLRVPTYRKKQ